MTARRGPGWLTAACRDDLQGTGPARRRLPETFGYTLKRKLLGPPLVNEQIADERLSRPLALGVLSCDGISSAAYGTEEMLIEMIPIVGLAAFTLILPMTLVILAGIALVVLSYREVVSVYTRAGGSYVVARENFGPRVAQVAAVALLIDYTVTVAVQTAAGSAAIVSAFPQLANIPVIGPYILVVISVVAVVIMCYGNLRGIREAGRAFALPTYLFSVSVGLMIIVGLVREVIGSGLPHVTAQAGDVPDRAQHPGAAQHRDDLHAGEVLRQRRIIADRYRGGLQRGQRAAPAGGAQRPADPRHPGLHRRLPDRRDLLAVARHPRDPVSWRATRRCSRRRRTSSSAAPGTSCTSWCRRRPR